MQLTCKLWGMKVWAPSSVPQLCKTTDPTHTAADHCTYFFSLLQHFKPSLWFLNGFLEEEEDAG